jgi:hypothetical protein
MTDTTVRGATDFYDPSTKKLRTKLRAKLRAKLRVKRVKLHAKLRDLDSLAASLSHLRRCFTGKRSHGGV